MTPGAVPGARKRVRVNGVPRRASALASALRTVVFAPEDMLLVVGVAVAPTDQSLDTLVAQRVPGAARVDGDLRPRAHPAQQPAAPDPRGSGRPGRAALLGRDGGDRGRAHRALARRDARGARRAARGRARRDRARRGRAVRCVTVTKRRPPAGETPRTRSGAGSAETAEKEVWNGATLVGPHRDDLAFELDGRDLAGFASRGQQRTAILAWKLAQLDLLTRHRRATPRCCSSTTCSASSIPSVGRTWSGASGGCPRRS